MDLKTNNHGHYGEDQIREEHPSYGQLSIGRTTGGNPNLYGSSIKHTNKISIEIRHSEKIRDLHRTWYFPRDCIVRIEMSPTQFADALTSMNTSGVPVTIVRLSGHDFIPECPETHTRQIFEKEFKERAKQVVDDMAVDFKTIKEMLAAGSPKVAARKAIIQMLDRIQTEIGSNIPFIQESFNEAVDKTVNEAKGEIEAFMESKVRSLGLEAAREKGLLPDAPPQLGLDDDVIDA